MSSGQQQLWGTDWCLHVCLGGSGMAYSWDIEADFDTLIDLMADMIDAQVDVRRTDGDDWIVDLQASP